LGSEPLTPDQISTFSGLLDFYSDRADNFTGLLMAGVFGIFSLLILIFEITPKALVSFFKDRNVIWVPALSIVIFFMLVYYALALLTLYCYTSYKHYVHLAEVIRSILHQIVEKYKVGVPPGGTHYNETKSLYEKGEKGIERIEEDNKISFMLSFKKYHGIANDRRDAKIVTKTAWAIIKTNPGELAAKIVMAFLPWLLLFLKITVP